jgi:hypothetical protein
MKNSFFFLPIIATILFLAACGDRTTTEGDATIPADPANTPIYATPTEAANKAKADLLAVLRQQPDINLGVDAETLAAATAGAPIKQQQLDFDRLLQQDSTTRFESLVQEALPTVMPLRSEQQVVTVVSIVAVEEGYQLAELAGQALTQDLNRVMAATQVSTEYIEIMQVPNLQATIYAVNVDGYISYHTRYNGLPIAEGLDENYLLEILGRDARRFVKKSFTLLVFKE